MDHEVRRQDDTVFVLLMYPRVEGHPKYVEVDMECVRSSPSVRLSYDFERDGWVFEVLELTITEDGERERWLEKGFAQSSEAMIGSIDDPVPSCEVK